MFIILPILVPVTLGSSFLAGEIGASLASCKEFQIFDMIERMVRNLKSSSGVGDGARRASTGRFNGGTQ
jgi:hypothetical protein